jgi:hypothetical protein
MRLKVNYTPIVMIKTWIRESHDMTMPIMTPAGPAMNEIY